ncbi:hypothetical protein ARMGADRAFT_1026193 [Armillaria gallica]|uniref:Uncharacterized protein n=1 Tax=Armillaria gallica TaxID=47427 RepID=A0A2H3DS72_ARMGA|nr:hypothetical protein ARMGADRAFT_1026193 [Armillaria gallica]
MSMAVKVTLAKPNMPFRSQHSSRKTRGWRTVVPAHRVGFTRNFSEQGQNFKKETFAGVATCPGIDQTWSTVLQSCQTRNLQAQERVDSGVLQESKHTCIKRPSMDEARDER